MFLEKVMSNSITSIENKESTETKKGSAGFFIGIILAVIVIFALFATSYQYLSTQRIQKEEALAHLQRNITYTRAESIQTWLSGLLESTKRLAGSEIFRLFSEEMNKLPEGTPLLFSGSGKNLSDQGDEAEQLYSQIPFMQNLLSEFVRYSVDFQSARIVTSRGEPYLASDSVPPMTTDQAETAKRAVKESTVLYGPIQMSTQGELLLDMYIPIYSNQDFSKTPVAVLIVGINARKKLLEVLSPGDYRQQGLKLKLVQYTGKDYQVLIPEMEAFFSLPEFQLNEQKEYPFGLRDEFATKGRAYMYGYRVPTLNWWIIAEHNESYIGDSFKAESKAVYAVTGLLSLVLLLCFLAAWWWLIGRRQSSINKNMNNLLIVIEDQKKLLDGINSTISDPISLTDGDGKFVYVNKAFASAVGREEESCIGLDSPAVFGFDTAKRLNVSDQHVLLSGESVTINEVIWLRSKRYYFQISKTPLLESGSRTVKGIVSVFRDITQLIEMEKRSHRVVQQTIDALVSTIEEADPFLGGHSRIMGAVASLVSKQLGLTDIDVATVEAAANLSQVGKMFVPREIVLKPSALSPEEKHEMERHVEYAYNVLKDIEFDLPVIDAITQMNERLDGKGYPNNLSGDKISLHAKVLAVANAFAAMARPRSYRPALPIDEVLTILERDSGTMFDATIVRALREVLGTAAGENLIALAAQAKAV